ncbi:MAG: molybdate ABC transporter substrate-binding protein [Undibacterium sp.]|nr:molybdate ABC transporter substrate-binding protein [Undibacterium sp.]
MKIKQIALIAIYTLCTFGTLNVSARENLTVAVAANMQFVFNELKAEFKKQTGHNLQGVFSSSGKLVAQISNGAAFDVFLSADMTYPAALYQQGLTTAPPKLYGYGVLVLWSMREFDVKNWQAFLQDTAVHKIAIANPETAPFGVASLELLKTYKLDKVLKPRLVFAESISQTNQYIYSGLVEAGFTSKSVVVSAEMKGKGVWTEMPRSAYAPIAQGAVVLKIQQHNKQKTAQLFLDFLASTTGKSILQRNGIEPVEGAL